MISLFAMLSVFGFLGLLVILGRLFRYPVRNLFDVIELARPTSDAEFKQLLDPEYEAKMRSYMSRDEFREEQRIRIHKLFDCTRHRSFNALLIAQFAYLEWRKWAREPETKENRARLFLLQEVLRSTTEMRVYSLSVIPTLALWILFRVDRWPVLVPRLSELREAANKDGIYVYSRLTTAVGYLSLFYGERCYDALMLKLHGAIPKEF
jgi:hypothetical protein